MTTLLIAEHDNKSLKDSTNKALTAAKALGGDVHILVAGKDAKAVADAAAKLDGVKKVLLADAPAVVRQIQIDVGVEDQAVVADHRYRSLLRGVHDLRRRLGVVGDDDQHLHAALEQRLRLLQLLRIVAFGRFDQDVGVELFGALDEEVTVALPAFLRPQRIHEQTDLRARFFRRFRPA